MGALALGAVVCPGVARCAFGRRLQGDFILLSSMRFDCGDEPDQLLGGRLLVTDALDLHVVIEVTARSIVAHVAHLVTGVAAGVS